AHAALLDIDDPDDFTGEWLHCKCGAWELPRARLLSQLDAGAPWILPNKMVVYRKTGDDSPDG
ncbi:hypothetical protein ACQ7B2_00630, partial [Escherichia coli]